MRPTWDLIFEFKYPRAGFCSIHAVIQAPTYFDSCSCAMELFGKQKGIRSLGLWFMIAQVIGVTHQQCMRIILWQWWVVVLEKGYQNDGEGDRSSRSRLPDMNFISTFWCNETLCRCVIRSTVFCIGLCMATRLWKHTIKFHPTFILNALLHLHGPLSLLSSLSE